MAMLIRGRMLCGGSPHRSRSRSRTKTMSIRIKMMLRRQQPKLMSKAIRDGLSAISSLLRTKLKFSWVRKRASMV
jgi:hypothetical protein